MWPLALVGPEGCNRAPAWAADRDALEASSTCGVPRASRYWRNSCPLNSSRGLIHRSSRVGAIAASPPLPAPRSSRISTVSATSSLWWPTAMRAASTSVAILPRYWRRASRPAASIECPSAAATASTSTLSACIGRPRSSACSATNATGARVTRATRRGAPSSRRHRTHRPARAILLGRGRRVPTSRRYGRGSGERSVTLEALRRPRGPYSTGSRS